MKLLLQSLAAFVLVDGLISPVDENSKKCTVAGGPHGKEFDDSNVIYSGQLLMSLKLCGIDVVDGIGVSIWSSETFDNNPFHGLDKNCQTITLEYAEYITSIEIHSVKIDSKTRVDHVKLLNQEGKAYEVGKPPNRGMDGISNCTAPNGYQLAGFLGRSEDGIYSLGAIWNPLPERWPTTI